MQDVVPDVEPDFALVFVRYVDADVLPIRHLRHRPMHRPRRRPRRRNVVPNLANVVHDVISEVVIKFIPGFIPEVALGGFRPRRCSWRRLRRRPWRRPGTSSPKVVPATFVFFIQDAIPDVAQDMIFS